MVEITEESLPAIKALAELSLNEGNVGYSSLKQEIEMYYKGYTGKVFLLMSDWLSSVHYQVVEMTNKLLCYFGDIEAVLAQDKMAQDKWIQLFSS